jgi:surface antigen
MKIIAKLSAALVALLFTATVVVTQVTATANASALTTGSWPKASGPQAANQYYGYPYRNAPDCQEDANHPGIDCTSADLDSWGFYQGQCTSWAAYRLNQLTGAGFTNTYKLPKGQRWSNAGNWETAAHTAGIAVNGTPAVGSIAWYKSGHVAVVEQVNSPTSIVISEMNTDYHNGFAVHAITTTSTTTGSGWPTAFIHIKDVPQTATPPAPPSGYHAGRQVTIDKHATGGVSGHKGPGNSYAVGPTRPANSALWIVCYVTGQSIKGPYDTTAMWDLSDDGYYYTDAWLYTGTNGAAVPKCAPKTVTVAKQATGGVSGHKGPGNSYAAGPTHAANTPVTIFCYVTGQSIKGPYDTTAMWDLSNDGYYYTDAWLYTGTNGAAVPHC